MNKFRLLFSIVLGLLFFASATIFSAQTAKIKTQYKSSGNLGTIPAGTFPIYSGNHTVGKWMKVYLTADTTGGISSFAWAISKPAGSATILSSSSTQNVTFTPDSSGQYIVTLTVGTTTDADTFWVSTYKGATGGTPNCSQCHNATYLGWQQTPHAKIFQQGVEGQLETASVNNQLVGTYGTSCIKCHTTGWDPSANNGNFGFLAHQSGYDTTWYKTYTGTSSFSIPTNSTTAWDLLNTPKYSNALPVSNIGCESCHGPGADHVATFGNTSKISNSLDAGVCLQCHEAPTHHMVGTYYNASNHATMPLAGLDATSTSCFPCHSGSAYFKYSQNRTTPGYSSADASQPITCAVCHDPHTATNYGLRLVPVTLKNNFSVSSGGNGQLCMTCHQARKNAATTITSTAPYYGFSDRFGPHHGPQSDMFWGQNAYQYGDSTLSGMNTHGGLTDACVTCHMQTRTTNSNHQWNMSDSTGDYVTVCKSCHGQSLTSFNDIKASSDWDGNGKIEGVQTEVQGMVAKLAALLPKDASGNVVSMMVDSLKVKGQPSIVKGIYTYYFVTSDNSNGVHNAKYTVAILQKALTALGSTTPVELTSFTGSASSVNQVNLSWETVTEANNKGFEVQRKSGGSWNSEGFVNGKGTTTNITKYSFSDKLSNVSGNVTFRLKQVDMNGTFQYSKEVEVSVAGAPQSFSLSQNYPNPFNPSTTIQYALPYASNVKVIIYNITGAVIKVLINSSQEAGVHQAIMNTTSNGMNLSSGIYFYTIQATSLDGAHSFKQTKKMILLK
jgi:cytochrome c1